MKKFLVLLICFLSFVSFSQDDKAEINQKARFKIGIVAQPNLAYRRLVNKSGIKTKDSYIDLLNTYEIPKLGYNFGINTEIRLTDKLFLETGINYSNKGYRTKKLKSVLFPSESNELALFRGVYGFHYLEVPLLLNYSIGKKRLKFVSAIGLCANILTSISGKTILYNTDGTKESDNQKIEITNYNKFNLSPTVGLGVEYQINQNSKIKVQPIFSYGVLKILDSTLKKDLWSTGLQFGFYFGI